MQIKRIFSIIVLSFVIESECFLNNAYPQINSYQDAGDPGKPLFLTPYIENGNIGKVIYLVYCHFVLIFR